MFYPMKLILFTVLTFILIASTSAIPIGTLGADNLVTRGGNGEHSGWATYYNVEEGTGACGGRNKNTEHVVAIGGANKSTCGKTATVTYKGKSVKVKVVDECPVCGHDNIDLSPSAFEQLAPKREGRLNGISWKYD